MALFAAGSAGVLEQGDGYEGEILLSPKLMLMSPSGAVTPKLREDAIARFFDLDVQLANGEGQAVGRGVTGSVYSAFDSELQRPVATKVMKNDRGAAWEIDMIERARTRLARVGKADAIPLVHGAFEMRGGSRVALVMDMLEPIDGKMSGAASKYARGMRRCLEALHSVGIAHGDVHLGNFMYDASSKSVRIVDFGLSFDYLSNANETYPTSPRGKRYDDLSWNGIKHAKRTRARDYYIDDAKLEATIDQLSA